MGVVSHAGGGWIGDLLVAGLGGYGEARVLRHSRQQVRVTGKKIDDDETPLRLAASPTATTRGVKISVF